MQLLREGSWFDIPILFSDQTRALLTFEKGIPGDKVFETVMSGWTPSDGALEARHEIGWRLAHDRVASP